MAKQYEELADKAVRASVDLDTARDWIAKAESVFMAIDGETSSLFKMAQAAKLNLEMAIDLLKRVEKHWKNYETP